MNISRLIKIGAVVQLARMGLSRRRRIMQRRQRRNRSLGLFTLAAGALAAWTALSFLRREKEPLPLQPQPSKKKLAREARRAEAARRAHQPASARPPVIHVEVNASPDLKVPLKDLSR